MKISDDYQCSNCGRIFIYEKPYGEVFPKNPECSFCKSTETKRKITPRGTVIPDYMKSINN